MGCVTNLISIPTYHGDNKFNISEYQGNCQISFVSERDLGVINDLTYEAFLRVIADIDKRNCNKKTFMFSSSGGSVNSAIKIGALINKNGYDTSLQIGRGCSSACGIIFIAGKERTALTSKTLGESSMGFHQASKTDLSGSKSCIEPSAFEYQAIENYARKVLPVSVSNDFISLVKSTNCNSMRYIKADELGKLGIATKILPHGWGI